VAVAKLSIRRPWRATLAGLLFVAPAVALAPAASAQTVVAVGPSTTAGRGVWSSQAYPAQLEALLRARGISATVVNAGVNGEQTPAMLARLNRTVPDGTALVILQLAAFNDLPWSLAGRDNPIPPAETERNFRAMVQAMRARGIPTIVFTRMGGGRGATHVAYPRFTSSVDLQPDRIHPTAEGHAKLAALLLPAAERILRARR
jgi:acyl-CoA thioesterase-1